MVTIQMVLEKWFYLLFDHLTRLLAGESVTEKKFVCLFVSFFLFGLIVNNSLEAIQSLYKGVFENKRA